MCCSLCFRFRVIMSDVGDGDGEPNVLKLGSDVSLANIAYLDWKYDVPIYGAMPLASLTFPPWTETSIFTRPVQYTLYNTTFIYIAFTWLI